MTRAKHKWQSRTKRDLIIEVWEALDCESVGEAELVAIQATIGETLGEGAIDSPAAIARVVAEEGAVLRHPEILECDFKWRDAKASLIADFDFSTLRAALDAFRQLELKRSEFEAATDTAALGQLRLAVTGIRESWLLTAKSKIAEPRQRNEAAEVAEWIRVWLLTPDMFQDWLDLRMRSDEFQANFGHY
ncbi:MAG TPA: hypothetical protein VJT50_02350 [Pyrinomonadaceae bacterium]|nr:hypothetical protein [Pyrinomonadaceae bacterium]